MKYIQVKFTQSDSSGLFLSKCYSYKTTLDVAEGDLVVVQVYNTYAVGKVCSVSSIPNKIATKWAIQKVDVTLGEGLLKKEQDRAEIVAALDAKLKAKAETSKYDVLRDDPEASELLKRLYEMLGQGPQKRSYSLWKSISITTNSVV